MSATTPSSFTSVVLSHLDIFHQCPHYLFDDLSEEGKQDFEDSIQKLLEDMKQEGSFKSLQNHSTTSNKFETLRHKRMQCFPDALGEQNWYNILRWSSSTLIHSALRRVYVRYYSWGVACKIAIETIKQYSPVLEVGAGNGYWAYELARNGVDVIATDNFSDLVEDFEPLRYWSTVKRLDAVGAVKKYPGRTLLMCWPHGYALDALEEFGLEEGPQTVIIIGEKMDNDKTKYGDGEVGCVTDDPFGGVNKERDSMMMSQVRDILDNRSNEQDIDEFDPKTLHDLADRYKKMKARWELMKEIPIPNFVTTEEEETICDSLYIWKKK